MNSEPPNATSQTREQASDAAADNTGYRRLEVGVQAFLFVLAVVIALNSLQLGLTVAFGPGPGFFPFYLSIGMGLLVLAWMVNSARAARTANDLGLPSDTALDEDVDYPHVYNVIASLIVLAAVMGFLGYQISMFLFLYYHLAFRAKRMWYTSLIIALAGSVGIFHVFNDLLSVALPLSVFDFLNVIGI